MAGIERVVILDSTRPNQTFHAMGNVKWLPDTKRTKGYTQCGREFPDFPWWLACLRRPHAEMFARPCGRCYPKVSDA